MQIYRLPTKLMEIKHKTVPQLRGSMYAVKALILRLEKNIHFSYKKAHLTEITLKIELSEIGLYKNKVLKQTIQ